jgi:hypothetical protein
MPKKMKYLFGSIDFLRHGQEKVSIHHPFKREYQHPMYKYKDDLKTFYDQTNAKVMSK